MARTILVVEDEPNIALALEFLLARAGYAVRLARDGAEALESVARAAPDMLMLDVMMPGLSGYEVCRQVRERHGDAVRIVMLSARGREAEVSQGLAAGADRYVVKPFAPDELLGTVRELLARPVG